MPADVILGLQWGDEGKGKLVDLLTDEYDCIVRYQGGDNAGHTVVRDGKKLKFHLMPSGIATEGKLAVIGNGVVVNMKRIIDELTGLESAGLSMAGFRISERAFVVLPTHVRSDQDRESGADAIGTTSRGIGPAYTAKIGRDGIRMGDFLEPDIEKRLREKKLTNDEIAAQRKFFERLAPFVCDTVPLLQDLHAKGRPILLEGAQGIMLDIDFGTYPYVTSSSPTPAGGCIGTGLPVQAIRRVIGVLKAYTTRVGKGPFPTELLDETGDRIREKGQEYGTTTGRPRRCGWLDLVQLRYAIGLCGVTDLAVMKLDVLSGLEKVRAASRYTSDGAPVASYPSRIVQLERVAVEYEDHAGWSEEIAGIREREKLPAAAAAYLAFMQERLGPPIRYVSTSPDRVDTLRF